MPEVEVVDEVVGTGPAKVNGVNRRPMVEETVEAGTSRVIKSGHAGIVEEDVLDNSIVRRDRTMKDSTKKLLEIADSYDGDDEEVDDPDLKALEAKEAAKPAPKAAAKAVETTVDDDEEVDETKEAAAPPAAKVVEATEEVVEEKPDEHKVVYDKLRGDYDRIVAANRKLAEDYETERKRPRNELPERMKMLDEADKMYLDDSIGAIRRVIATALGVKHDSKEVDEELEFLYTDLTAQELEVPLQEARKASRDAARTKQMLARDKRERQAENETSKNRDTQDDDTRQLTTAMEHITQLNTAQADGSTLLGKYPLLMNFAERLDGMKPEALLWRVLQRETKTGVIKPGTDTEMLEQAAVMVETHYEALSEQFSKVKPKKQTDTTKQSEADDKASKDQRQSKATRTITNANASVAPATPPAKKPIQETTERPKFKSKKEAQDWALRHIPE